MDLAPIVIIFTTQVFLAQLHRRAEVLNEKFQEWIVSVIMGHAIVQEIEEFGNDDEFAVSSNQGDADVGDDGMGSSSAAFPGAARRRLLKWRTPSIWDKLRKKSLRDDHGGQVTADIVHELGSPGSSPAVLPDQLDAPDQFESPAPFLRAASAASDNGFTRAASAASNTGAGAFTRAASAASNTGAGGFTRAASAASSTGGSALGRTASDALRRISSGIVGGLKRLKNMGFGRQSLSGSIRARGGDGASVATPSLWLKSAVAADCIFVGLGRARVEVYPAPVKTLHRMREKVREYASDAAVAGRGWPLCANILDPVRASVVCSGPAVLQVLEWFTGAPVRGDGASPSPGSPGPSSSPSAATGAGGSRGQRPPCADNVLMPVCRVKNKFAFPKEELVGG
jgi:hypothetical protein